MRSNLTRQKDLIPEVIFETPVSIVGAGAIGSWVALSLAKMGFEKITVYDDDTIEDVNLPSQLYPLDSVGVEKVVALKKLVKDFTSVEINAVQGRFTVDSELGAYPSVMISAVDSMRSRVAIYRACQSSSVKYLIDPRMGAETALLYVIRPRDEEDQKRYEKTLYSDEEAVSERCTAKATIYTANMLSGLVCKTVKDCLDPKSEYKWHSQWSIKDHDFAAFD